MNFTIHDIDKAVKDVVSDMNNTCDIVDSFEVRQKIHQWNSIISTVFSQLQNRIKIADTVIKDSQKIEKTQNGTLDQFISAHFPPLHDALGDLALYRGQGYIKQHAEHLDAIANLLRSQRLNMDGPLNKLAEKIRQITNERNAIKSEYETAKEGWHLANNTTDLAMKHRADAERLLEQMKAKLRTLLNEDNV